MADHPSNGRVLSDEEKAKYRDWQTNEILRRRGALPPDAAVVAAGPPACPKCRTPYRNPVYKRCFACQRAAEGKPEPKPQPTPKPVPAPRPAPAEPVDLRCQLVPIPVPPAPGALLVASGLPAQSMVSALRGVVEILRSLDDDSARWVLESAYQLSRSQP